MDDKLIERLQTLYDETGAPTYKPDDRGAK
jgi:hypothetical protein